jgi:N-acetylmuramoyl-L-alanine amidase
MMFRKAFFLFIVLFMGLGLLPTGGNAAGLNSSNIGDFEEGSSYYFIHYNGEEQEIVLSENVTLILTGWADESKSTINAKVDIRNESSNQTNEITMNVTDELSVISVSELENIYYRIDSSDSFKVEQLEPRDLKNQDTVITKNENGMSIEETETIDEYGTVIRKLGPTYYKTETNNQKVAITKDQYDLLNPVSASTIVVQESQEILKKTSLSTVQPTTNPLTTSTQSVAENPSVVYATHVQDIGWQNAVSDGEMSGTSGKAKRLESIRISINNVQDLGIKYSTHVQDYGWLNYVSNGKDSGTTGKAKRLEGIKIELTGNKAEQYDIVYRVHAQDYGWMNWVKNGELAGTTGKSKRLEAIEIVIKEKNPTTPPTTTVPSEPEEPTITDFSVVYKTHVQNIGWMGAVNNGALSGTTGKALRLEAIQISLKNTPYTGGVSYKTHVQDYGWLENVSDGDTSGKVGLSKRMEAISIELTGEIAKHYDVYYRVHAQDYGWLGWAKNGMKAGSEGRSKRLEAIEIKLVPTGQGEAVSEEAAFKRSFTVFLDPGHGGVDPGAVAGGIKEADLNLAVAKKVQALLVNRGYSVIMSRNNDTTVELLDRPKIANELKVDLFVSIHTNSGPTSADGIEAFYYQYKPEYPSTINQTMHNNPERISRSMKLTNLIQENLVDYTNANNRGTEGASFAVIRESAMPATLVEIGFISNSTERQKLVTTSYQNILANAIADGIVEYYKIY